MGQGKSVPGRGDKGPEVAMGSVVSGNKKKSRWLVPGGWAEGMRVAPCESA